MTTILLDANVYDKLQADGQSRASLRALLDRGLAKVIATPMVLQELQRSPFGGLPDWFPVTVEAENVTVLSFAPLGMTGLGEGVVYDEHRGESKKIAGAIIADSANALADILVLEDRRCRERLKKISARCTSLDYEQFREWLRASAALSQRPVQLRPRSRWLSVAAISSNVRYLLIPAGQRTGAFDPERTFPKAFTNRTEPEKVHTSIFADADITN